jgi:hypothetical protein
MLSGFLFSKKNLNLGIWKNSRYHPFWVFELTSWDLVQIFGGFLIFEEKTLFGYLGKNEEPSFLGFKN